MSVWTTSQGGKILEVYIQIISQRWTGVILMVLKNFAAVASIAVLASVLNLATTDQAAQAKTKKTAQRAPHSYFVPPPPPYVPSILPEMKRFYGNDVEADSDVDSVQTPQSRWSKYIYVRNGYAAPQSVSPNKYVTNWNNKS